MKVQLVNPETLKSFRLREPVRWVIDEIIKMGKIHQPIIVNKQMVILDGVNRWTAAKELGLKEVPIIIVGDET